MKEVSRYIFALVFCFQIGVVSAIDSFDSAISNCESRRLATGKYFLWDLTEGRQNLKASSLRIVNECQREFTAWVEACVRGGGTRSDCTKEGLYVTQVLVEDAWSHRDDLQGWLRLQLEVAGDNAEQQTKNEDVVLDENPQFTELILKADPVEVDGQKVKIWDRRDYKEPYQLSTKGKVLSSKSQVEFDCANNKFRFVFAIFYSKNAWEGDVVETISEIKDWQTVPPDTTGEKSIQLACKYVKNQQRRRVHY